LNNLSQNEKKWPAFVKTAMKFTFRQIKRIFLLGVHTLTSKELL